MRVTIGIFVGGKGRRMGGVAKGLLHVPNGSETLIERLLRQCARAAPDSALLLVGEAAPYAALAIPHLDDAPAAVGPIGGTARVARARAGERKRACAGIGMRSAVPRREPHFSAAFAALRRGARACVDGRLQPLAAAYAPAATLRAVDRSLALGEHALMSALGQLGSDFERVEFDAERARALRDWDTPEDVLR